MRGLTSNGRNTVGEGFGQRVQQESQYLSSRVWAVVESCHLGSMGITWALIAGFVRVTLGYVHQELFGMETRNSQKRPLETRQPRSSSETRQSKLGRCSLIFLKLIVV